MVRGRAFASVSYNGYGHFDSDEWCGWIGEMGAEKSPEAYGAARRKLATVGSPEEEARLKAAGTYGGPGYVPASAGAPPAWHQHFGPVVVSCERGDIRPLPDSVCVYGDLTKERRPLGRPAVPRFEVIDELYEAVVNGTAPLHDGEWARSTLEVCLALLVGAPVGPTPATVRLDTLQMPPLRVGLPSDLLAQRPDIMAAEHQLRAAQAQIGAARAAFFPRVALTGSLGTASAELGGLFDSGSQAWTFSPTISVPLFNGGRLRNNLNLTEVRRDIAVANYEKTVQGAFRDVSDALVARQLLARQLAIAQDARAAQSERARLSQLRYDHGAAAFLEVLDAQRDLLVADQQVVQLRRALLSSQVSLYAALGGGALAAPGADTSPTRPVP